LESQAEIFSLTASGKFDDAIRVVERIEEGRLRSRRSLRLGESCGKISDAMREGRSDSELDVAVVTWRCSGNHQLSGTRRRDMGVT